MILIIFSGGRRKAEGGRQKAAGGRRQVQISAFFRLISPSKNILAIFSK